MRGLSTMYMLACEEEQTLSNSGLVELFRRLDMADTMEEACPRHLDISGNVLGDAGAAAFFRTLAVMRWVESVDLRETGVGLRAIAVLCDTTMCTDSTLLAPAGTGPHHDETLADADVFATTDLVAPVPALCALNLHGNPVFQVSGKLLLSGLQQRERVVKAFQAAHPTAAIATDLPGLDIELELQNFQPTLAKKLLGYKLAASRRNARRQRRRELAAEADWLRLFCVPGSLPSSSSVAPVTAVGGLPRLVGSQAVYRIPEFVPELFQTALQKAANEESAAHDGVATSVASLHHLKGAGVVAPAACAGLPPARIALAAGVTTASFYDWLDPVLQGAVHRWNDFMDAYLIAFHSFRAAGAGPTAAAQLCAELGADALTGLTAASTSAFVWTRHAARRAALALVAAEATNAQKDDMDRLEPLELWLAVSAEESSSPRKSGLSTRQIAARDAADRQQVHTEEMLTNVGKLLRTLYACPSLEAAVLKRDTFILPSYLQRLRTWYYQVGAAMFDETAETATTKTTATDSIDDIKLLYYRIVAAFVTRPLTSLGEDVAPLFEETEARLRTIRRLVVDGFGAGQVVSDVAPLAASPASPSRLPQQALMMMRGALPIFSAKAHYVQTNDAAVARAWRAAYDAHETIVAESGSTPFVCTCGADHLATVRQRPASASKTTTTATTIPRPVHLTVDDGLSRPCEACCHEAIAVLGAFLRAPHTLARLETLRLTQPPTLALTEATETTTATTTTTSSPSADGAARVASELYWLPVEFRQFIADLVLRQATVRRGGCAFVPNLLGRTSSIHAPYYPIRGATTTGRDDANDDDDDGVWGLVELLAALKGDVERLKDLVGAFEEWFRLQAIEAFDVTRTAAAAVTATPSAPSSTD